jgi:hypothetical protein
MLIDGCLALVRFEAFQAPLAVCRSLFSFVMDVSSADEDRAAQLKIEIREVKRYLPFAVCTIILLAD